MTREQAIAKIEAGGSIPCRHFDSGTGKVTTTIIKTVAGLPEDMSYCLGAVPGEEEGAGNGGDDNSAFLARLSAVEGGVQEARADRPRPKHASQYTRRYA